MQPEKVLSKASNTQFHTFSKGKIMQSRSKFSLYAAWILGLMLVLPFFTTRVSVLSAQTPAKTDSANTGAGLGINIDELMADSDKPLYIRYGIFGGVTLNIHQANFTNFNLNRSPGELAPLSNGFPLQVGAFFSGLSYSVGGLFEYPLIDRFGIALRASVTNLGGFTMTGKENLLTASPTPGGAPFVLTIDHSLSIQNMLLAAAEPMLMYRVLEAFTLYAGVRTGFFLSPTYQYQQRIPEDSPVRFRTPDGQGTTVWDSQEGAIPFLRSFNLAATAGLSYEIPLDPGSGKWLLAIEAFYTRGLSQIADSLTLRRRAPMNATGLSSTRTVPVNDLGTDADPSSLAWPTTIEQGSWLADNIRAGLSVRYSPFRTIRPELTPAMQETFRKIKQIDSAIAVERAQNQKRLAQVDSINKAIAQRVEELKKVGISVNISKVVGVDASGKEMPGKPKLLVEQFRKSVTQPILPAVFFDEGSFTIPSKYRRLKSADRGTFKLGDLANKSNYEIYRHVLNIVGKRMEENPAAVLFVTGCNSNTGAEAGNQKLSEQRAQAVSDYLQDAWKIQAKRIIIQKRDLPENPSNSADAAGVAENRRVDLSSTLPELLAPIVSDVVAKIPNPPILRFGLEINAGAGLKQWNFETTQFQDDEVATVFQRTGTNTYPTQLDWNLAQEANTVPSSGQDLTIQLTMTDINNKAGDAPLVAIPVEQINIQKKEAEGKADQRIDWFDVIGFTGGMNPALDETNQKIIETIKAKIKSDATVNVNAFTDNTGDVAQNKQIAQKRAEFVAKAIGAANAKINAQGPTTQYDNNNPEGRMYNRFVRVEILTPTGGGK